MGDYAGMDFGLRPDSPLYTKLRDFKPIAFARIGLYRDEYRRQAPPRPVIERPLHNLLLKPAATNTVVLDRIPKIAKGTFVADLPFGWALDQAVRAPFSGPLTVHLRLPADLDHSNVGTILRFAILSEERTLLYQFVALIDYPDPQYGASIPVPRQNWNFRLDPNDIGRAERWFEPNLNERAWALLEIERPWGFFGYEYHGIAWYRRTIMLPPAPFEASRTLLAFGGVDEQAWVWINGDFAGAHDIGPKGWNRPFVLDVTPLLRWGAENQLTVRVRNTFAAGGIWKPIWVHVPTKMQATEKRH